MRNSSKYKDPAALERMAEILVEAYISRDDRKTAERHGITDRTLRNWRMRLDTEPELSRIFLSKKARVSEGWADEVPGALRSAISFVRRAAEQGDAEDASMVQAVTNGIRTLSEVAATWKLLDQRLADHSRAAEEKATPAQQAASLPN